MGIRREALRHVRRQVSGLSLPAQLSNEQQLANVFPDPLRLRVASRVVFARQISFPSASIEAPVVFQVLYGNFKRLQGLIEVRLRISQKEANDMIQGDRFPVKLSESEEHLHKLGRVFRKFADKFK